MAKKKAATSGKRLNRELLERARQQARAIEAEDADDEVVDESAGDEAETVRRVEPVRPNVAPGTQRRSVSTAKRLREKNEETRRKGLTADDISELLASPTKVVTEEHLREQYSFVIRDLRNMAVLAAASFVFLVALSVVLPR
jgi:hypothetical protein